jgi:adenine/guanine phosphoribosyltransferase-like PRPP-binding protein
MSLGLEDRESEFYLNVVAKQKHRAKTIEMAVECLSKFDFDTIVVTGVSGLLLGPIVAHLMGKNIAVIRKHSETSHSANRIEGELGKRYVILDDFICTGDTVIKIKREIAGKLSGAVCVGLYSYFPETYHNHEHAIRKHRIAGVECLNKPFGYEEPTPPPEPAREIRNEYKAVIDCKILPTDPPPPVVTEITFALKDAEPNPEIKAARSVLLRMQREMDSLVNAEIKITKMAGIDTNLAGLNGLDKFKKWYSPASEPYKTTVTDLDKPPDKPPKEFGFGPEFFISKMPRIKLRDLLTP